MKIEHCLYILEVASVGSVRKAAEKLFITQQGLSHAIKSVEGELGVEIFSRSECGLVLTAAGQAVVEHFRQMAGSYRDLLADVSQQNGTTGSITIYYSHGVGTMFAPSIVNRLAKRYPRLSIRMFPCEADRLPVDMLDSESIILFSAPVKRLKKLIDPEACKGTYHRMVTVPITCITSLSSPYACRKVITVDDLRTIPVAIFDHERGLLNDVLGNYENANVVFIGSDHSLCKDVVSNTASVGFTNVLTEYYFKRSNMVEIPFSGNISLSYGCMVSSEPLSPAVEDCLDMAREELSRFAAFDQGAGKV